MASPCRARSSGAWSSLLSRTSGLALSLSGITGIIVSVGVTVDSYVVFFERLKDEVRAGRSMRNGAQRAFSGAWHTILVADLVSLIGALVLWYLTVGSVRNFAFFLGLSTLCDLAVAYFFTRPSVLLLSRTHWMARRKVMGIEASRRSRAMSTDVTPTATGATDAAEPFTTIGPDGLPPRRNVWGRLYHGETTIDFYGRRWWTLGLSMVLILVTLLSLGIKGLNLGIDFEGGVSWEVPSQTLTVDQARAVLEQAGIQTDNVKIVERTSTAGRNLLISASDQPLAKQQEVRIALAEAAGVDEQSVSSSSVSSTWGASITKKAIRALVIFLVLVALFIAWRFEWRMALSAIIAMVHDVLISVGVYSVFGFEVTPATVVAFLTILGFSLYDTIVVFDKVQENESRYASSRVPYADVINVSMNQVLMRSLNTSLAAVLPVLSLLIVGSGVMGAVALREFSLALLVGLITGSYSSIFVATPVLAILKERMPKYHALRGVARHRRRPRAPGPRRCAGRPRASGAHPCGPCGECRRRADRCDGRRSTRRWPRPAPKAVLTHPPRPRKKKRR